jgi:hypothetical protein
MKTTIELPDDLVIAAKRAALEQRTTLRQLVETSLRQTLAKVDSSSPHPLQVIASVGQNDWRQTPADDYVTKQRANW